MPRAGLLSKLDLAPSEFAQAAGQQYTCQMLRRLRSRFSALSVLCAHPVPPKFMHAVSRRSRMHGDTGRRCPLHGPQLAAKLCEMQSCTLRLRGWLDASMASAFGPASEMRPADGCLWKVRCLLPPLISPKPELLPPMELHEVRRLSKYAPIPPPLSYPRTRGCR